MKPIITIGIVILFCFAEIKPVFPILEYYLNYKYISEVLCTNKDKPLSGCNGKCYLREQLKEVQESEKQEKNIPIDTLERIPMILSVYELPKFERVNTGSKNHITFYQFLFKDLYHSPPKPPPK